MSFFDGASNIHFSGNQSFINANIVNNFSSGTFNYAPEDLYRGPVPSSSRVSNEQQVTWPQTNPFLALVDESRLQEESEEEEHGITRCVCSNTGEEGLHDGEFMIQCDTCEVWQHGSCMEINPEDRWFDDNYYCEQCRPELHTKLLESLKLKRWDNIRCILEEVLENEQQSKNLLEAKGEDAQLWLDALQTLAKLPNVVSKLRSSTLRMMLHLSKRSGLYPQCLTIQNVKKLGEYPVAGGGFGDVWKGTIREQTVCLKVVKVYQVSVVQQLLQEYMREAILWQLFNHPNLLPFMGMYYLDEAREQLCLVSPWMERGNLVQFLKVTPTKDVDRNSLVYDVVSGISYLHSVKIVHGDLKGINILITPDKRACIGDFGLSRVADSHALKLTSSTMHAKGTTRWIAPELLMPDPPCASSTFSDMYAFACVCYEIFTGNIPFQGLKDGAVIVAVLIKNQHPSRPDLALLDNKMWDIMMECWNFDPERRPAASEVLTRLTGTGGTTIRPAPDWDAHNLTQIWKDVNYPPLDEEALIRLQKNLGSAPVVQESASLETIVANINVGGEDADDADEVDYSGYT